MVLLIIVGGVSLMIQGDRSSSSESAATSTLNKPSRLELLKRDLGEGRFGKEQNDPEGYGGAQWGITLANFQSQQHLASRSQSGMTNSFLEHIEPNDTNPLLARLFGVPQEQRSVGLVAYPVINWDVVPRTFQSEKKDDVEYVFYNGRLSLTFSELNASNYDAVLADLAGKYTKTDSSHLGWDAQQLAEEPDQIELQMVCFKRGATNTRIYLLKRLFHATGLGYRITTAYLMYVPNTSYLEIEDGINGNNSELIKSSASERAEEPGA